MNYLVAYLVGIIVTYFACALYNLNQKQIEFTPAQAYVTGVIWPLAIVVVVMSGVLTLFRIIFEKISQP
jgi:hypothetical protein